MRHVKMLGLCAVAVLAVAAYAVSSASAAKPEWGQCYAKEGGKYEDSNCQVKAKGKTGKHSYEWRKATEVSNKKFVGANVGSGGVLTTESAACIRGKDEGKRVPRSKCIAEGGEISVAEEPLKIECESERNHGEVAGTNKVQNVAVVFFGCKLFGSIPCANGTNEGEIRINTLKGGLGYISKEKKEVGVLLEPAAKHGAFTRFVCLGQLEVVVGAGNAKEGAVYSPESKGGYDGIVSPITPINKMTSGVTQEYAINAGLENIPSHFEGKHNELLEDYVAAAEQPEETSLWLKAGETITNENHQENGEEIEIKA